MNDRWRERDRWGAPYRDDDDDDYQRRREAYRESNDFWASDTGRREYPRYGSGNRDWDRDRDRGERSYEYSSLPGIGTNYGGGGWINEYSTDWRRSADRSPGRQRDWGGDYDRGYGRSTQSRWGEDRWGRSQNENRWADERSRYGGRDHERGWWDRTKDEVRSWMGDVDAEHRREADREYGHRGRGPKGYTRSDDRIREDVNDRLMEDWGVDATDIEVTVNAGEVTLSGTVDGRDSKRRAEDIAASVLGVKDVQNSLRVRRVDPFATSRETGTGSQTSTTTGSTAATGSTTPGSTTTGSTTAPLSTGSTISPTTPRTDRH